MKFCKRTLLALVLISGVSIGSYANPDSVSIDTLNDYRDWGWEVLLIRNNYISLAIVPSIGGRVLQYDLGTDTFMIVNEALFGDTFYSSYPTPYTGTWGYGGYKTWPAPQSRWNWTPPPIMAWGDYEYETLHASKDSVLVWMKGQTEQYQAPGLRFDRYITIYRNSTRVKVVTVLFNDNSSAESWSIWDVTQTIVRHETGTDYDNFAAYIPLASGSDIWDDGGGPDYQEVLPGIWEVKFVNQDGKLFSLSSEGWSCWVDERDKQCYAKLFNVIPGADYPDGGANVQYYTNSGSKYMEMEVLGPIEEIGPNGDSIIFIEDWYVATTDGPIYTANHGGVMRSPLEYDAASRKIRGEFAAFVEGTFRLTFLNSGQTEIASHTLAAASPDELTHLDQNISLPAGSKSARLDIYDADDNFVSSFGTVELPDDDSFIAYKTDSEIVIDGVGDEDFWDTLTWYSLYQVWLPYNDFIEPEDFTGRFKLGWNEEHLLMLVEVVDDSLYDGHTDPLDNYWNDDCVEVFVDEDHSGGNHLYSYNAFAYHVSTDYDVVDNNDASSTSLFNDHIQAFRTKQGNTYVWELAVNIYDDSYVHDGSSEPVTLTHGKEMGFSLAYCDNDGSAQRENFIGSKYLPQAQSNDSYINASLFGTLTLIDPENDPGDYISFERSELEVMLYPNPAEDQIFFRLENDPQDRISYQIRSLTGQLVLTGEFPSGNLTGSIDVSGLYSGSYIITISSGMYSRSLQMMIR